MERATALIFRSDLASIIEFLALVTYIKSVVYAKHPRNPCFGFAFSICDTIIPPELGSVLRDRVSIISGESCCWAWLVTECRRHHLVVTVTVVYQS